MAIGATAAHAGQGGELSRPVLDALSVAVEALAGSRPERVWCLSEDEVGSCVRVLGQLAAAVEAHLVTVLAEARTRGLGQGQGWGPVDWARALAPQLPLRTVTDADVVARAAAAVGGDARLGEVVDAATSGELPVGKAAQLVRFHQQVAGLADPTHLADTLGTLLAAARGPRGLAERDLAVCVRRTGDLLRPDRLVEHDTDTLRAHRSLTKSPGPLGLSRYTLLLDDEGAAVVDAAVDALAKPVRNHSTGSTDRATGALDARTPAARRADALLDLVTRAVTAPEGVPRQAKTTMLVTVPLPVLQHRARGAGTTLTGQVLSTDTIRRLACDADLVPLVLGTRGEILDQGAAVRLFTPAQTRHLWLRDHGCTFPGCSKPARWTDAHHLVHWADHGPTTTSNAALLCRAHHTLVHRHRYAGHLQHGPHGPAVEWDLRTGSYDQHLHTLRETGALPRPPDDRP